MEYNNDNRTPLDRIDSEFLAELLNDDCDRCVQRDRHEHHASRRNSRCERCAPRMPDLCDIREASSECDEHRHEAFCSPCGDGFKVPKLEGTPLAMVYSPHQEWEHIYEAETALERGTIFKRLDLPFFGGLCNSCNSNNRHGW